MSIFIKELIKRKISQLSIDELLHYGAQYGFSLTHHEASQIITYLQTNNVDPFDENDRYRMFQKLSEITDTHTANKAQNLFYEIIRSYGLEHLF